jgi:hypothetical protein
MANEVDRAIELIDAANAADPNQESGEPRELLYSKWLTAWVAKLAPEASDVLRLAARCQHVCRWTIPRASYPMTRPGYLRWRADLKSFHARKAGEILGQAGCSPETIEKVQALNLKKNFPKDPESQVLEDALCLVFLEHQLAELAGRTDDDKMINAIKKSWGKMSPEGRQQALSLHYGPRENALIQRAMAA